MYSLAIQTELPSTAAAGPAFVPDRRPRAGLR